MTTISPLPGQTIADLERVAARYAVAITPAMQELIDPTDPDDPIARQFVPDAAELNQSPDENPDPIGDDAHSPVAGIVHRYPDRVLLKLVHVCAVYCRFCFRREMVGPGSPSLLGEAALERALTYIAEHPEIWEVVVTGGDPLVVSSRRIAGLMDRLAAIGHVRIVRFHTRVPVVAPERVTPALTQALRRDDLTTYVAVHANHPKELTPDVRAAIGRLADAGVPLLGQTVLLKGINDDPETLAALMRALVEVRVRPYYLHHGDLAPGTSHFRTSVAEGQDLMRSLRGRVSGLCQPTYVLDIPGGHGKSPIGPSWIERHDEGYTVTDYRGRRHEYPPPRTDVAPAAGPALSDSDQT